MIGKSQEEVESLLPNRKPILSRLGEKKICLLRIEGQYFAFEPFCPHRGAELSSGWPNAEKEIVCPLHNYRFDLQTGQAKMGGCDDLKVYRTEIGDEGLLIEIGP